MKQKDIALILVCVIVSGFISFFIARAVFGSSGERQVKAEVVSPIVSEFSRPSDKYFNENSVNPTQLIQIGSSANTTPYTGR
jgi:hypothetical protein